jgi:hypothetical protein
MDQAYKASVIWKALAFWGVFMLLYGAYKFLPVFPLCLICGVTESNFQHYKAGFFSYLIVNFIEYAWNRRKIADQEGFLFSRMTATVFLPWIIFLLWYIAPALIGRWPNNTYEIVYANFITFFVGIFTVILEGGFEKIAYNRSIIFVLLTLFLVSILLYIVFTFRLPWADVFVEPAWR